MSARELTSDGLIPPNPARPRRRSEAFCEHAKTVGNPCVSCRGAPCPGPTVSLITDGFSELLEILGKTKQNQHSGSVGKPGSIACPMGVPWPHPGFSLETIGKHWEHEGFRRYAIRFSCACNCVPRRGCRLPTVIKNLSKTLGNTAKTSFWGAVQHQLLMVE